MTMTLAQRWRELYHLVNAIGIPADAAFPETPEGRARVLILRASMRALLQELAVIDSLPPTAPTLTSDETMANSEAFIRARPMSDEPFGVALSGERRAGGLSLAALGARVGVTAWTVRCWERGAWTPSRTHYDKLCELYPRLRGLTPTLDRMVPRRFRDEANDSGAMRRSTDTPTVPGACSQVVGPPAPE
jgi:hypothetical protein